MDERIKAAGTAIADVAAEAAGKSADKAQAYASKRQHWPYIAAFVAIAVIVIAIIVR